MWHGQNMGENEGKLEKNYGKKWNTMETTMEFQGIEYIYIYGISWGYNGI